MSFGRRRPASAFALAGGLALASVVAASDLTPSAAGRSGLGAPRLDDGDEVPPQSHLPPPPGVTSRQSERFGGGDAAGPSAEASISADGRYVAFSSFAADLVEGDTNGSLDIFVRDRLTGAVIRLPVSGRDPLPAGGRASDPSISPDGGFVAFTFHPPAPTGATVAASQPLVLLWDASSGSTRIASLDRNDRPAFGSFEPDVSEEGRYVAYTSLNPSIARGDNNRASDVFRVETATGTTTMISQTPSGTSPRGASRSPAIAADGNLVAFASSAPNILVPDPVVSPTPTTATGTLVQSVTVGATSVVVNVNGCAFQVTDSAGNGPGRVVLGSESRIVTGVTAGPQAGQNTLTIQPTASAHLAGEQVSQARVSGCSVGSNPDLPTLAVVDQIYVRDVRAATTELVSQTTSGLAGSGSSSSPAISSNGLVVAFVSVATDLAAGDFDSAGDVYVRDRSTATTTLLSGDMPEAGQVDISANGRFVVFASATSPVDGVEVYHRDRFDGETIHVSVARGGGDGGADNLGPVVSATGRFIAWTSTSERLIADDGNGFGDVFVRDLPPAGSIDPAELDFGTRAVGTAAPPGAATFTSVGWTPIGPMTALIAGGDADDFDLALDGCSGKILPRPTTCTMTVVFTAIEVGPRASTLRLTDAQTGAVFTVRLVGAGSNAELTLDPPIGPPGIVTIAEGTGFPANTEIVLEWTPGIDEHRDPVVTDDDGEFRTQVLVFHHDREGLRDLTASPADGSSFVPIAASFFVSKPTNSPPRFDPAAVGSEPPAGFYLR